VAVGGLLPADRVGPAGANAIGGGGLEDMQGGVAALPSHSPIHTLHTPAPSAVHTPYNNQPTHLEPAVQGALPGTQSPFESQGALDQAEGPFESQGALPRTQGPFDPQGALPRTQGPFESPGGTASGTGSPGIPGDTESGRGSLGIPGGTQPCPGVP